MTCLWRRMTPMTMIGPRCFLAILAAVLCTAAATTLCELSLVFLPFPTLVIGTLPNSTARFILSTQVPHNNARPILHIFRVVSHRELFNQREDVEIVGQNILLIFIHILLFHRRLAFIQQPEFSVNLELRDHVRALKVTAQIVVFGHVGEKLKRHQDILIARHHRQYILSRHGGRRTVAEVECVKIGSE